MDETSTRVARMYAQHFQQVYAYCRRRTSAETIDDAVSETFLVAWRRIDDVPDEPETLPWLFGVAYRVLSNQWRTVRRQNRLGDRLRSAGIEPMTIVDELVVTSDERARVVDALSRLRSRDQEILRLAYWEELPHAQIAITLETTPGAIKQRLHEARKRLVREYGRLETGQPNTPIAQKGGER